ncbi:MAG: DUF4335 domain-containing protein [Leptolyngbya sp. LCM1.Bin17]|nr:MAG: DUF4335 domain-containing protein [Leptolyngbya sp. LCM1.Bin17]
MAAIASLTTYSYQAGTCTLRLTGQQSPLSQVSDRPVLARSRFDLQIYAAAPTAATPGSTASADPSPAAEAELRGRAPQLSALAHLVHCYVSVYLHGDDLSLAPEATLEQGDYTLQPVGLTRHRLTAPQADGDAPWAITLSLLQLADLADVLEQANGAVQVLTEADLPQGKPIVRPRLPLWIGSAAAVLVAAVVGGQWLTSPSSPVVFSPSPDSIAEPDRETAQERALDPADQDQIAALEDNALTDPTATPPEPARDPLALDRPAPPASDTPADQPTEGRQPSPQPATPEAQPSPGNDVSRAQRSRPFSLEESPEADRADPDRAPMAATRAPLVAGSEPWRDALAQILSQQWPTTPDLPAPLRYRLTLDAEGTIIERRPMTAVSTLYQNSPDLPQVGTVLAEVAPGETITVEARFLPSGDVEILI